MSEQSTFWETADIEDNENKYIKFDDNNTVRYKPLSNDPDAKVNKFGTPQYTFEVLDITSNTIMFHSITSKQYMRALRDIYPIEGKDLCVKRSGKGFDTSYQVVIV